MVKKNACVFISGTGTNLKALIKNSRLTGFPINIKFVVSNKKNAKGILLAKKYSIPYKIIDTTSSLFEIKILNEINRKKISIICLAGYMKVLSKNFIKKFKGKILNIHPSLLPKYKGLNTFSKILRNHDILSGCTVHYVNEKLDSGKIILKKKFSVLKSDNINTLRNKTQKIEHLAYSEAITKIYKMN